MPDWMIFREGGQPPSRLHASHFEAEAELDRLMKKCPGSVFRLLKVVKTKYSGGKRKSPPSPPFASPSVSDEDLINLPEEVANSLSAPNRYRWQQLKDDMSLKLLDRQVVDQPPEGIK